MANDSLTPLKPVLGGFMSTRLAVLLHGDLRTAFTSSWLQEINDLGVCTATAMTSRLPGKDIVKAAMKVARRLSVDQSFDLEDRIRLMIHIGYYYIQMSGENKQEGIASLQAALDGMLEVTDMPHKAPVESVIGCFQLILNVAAYRDHREAYTMMRHSLTALGKIDGMYCAKAFRPVIAGLGAVVASTIPGQQAAVIACLKKQLQLTATDDELVSLVRHEFAISFLNRFDSATLMALRPCILKSIKTILDKLTTNCDQYHLAQRNQWLESAVELVHLHAEIESEQPPEGMSEILAKLYSLMNPIAGNFSLDSLAWVCGSMELSPHLVPSRGRLSLRWYHRRLDIRLVYLFDHAHAGTQPLSSSLVQDFCDSLAAFERMSPAIISKAHLPGLDARLAENGYQLNGQDLMGVLLQLDKNEVRIKNNFEMMRRLLQHVKTRETQK
eukprot:TRINITY_DN10371_c0_g1_i1.p1 TRINITY_DN10371_c0_g1~~TRINITY_DN10371_c0_g1_i1.p1  ORF type:complete len:442 (+),score=74.03 TRINITY_DN10371_c0_g1_i1:147-1472(+)